jgi:hypothetical protein
VFFEPINEDSRQPTFAFYESRPHDGLATRALQCL